MTRNKQQDKRREEVLNTIPVFLAKTYRIVDDQSYKDSIGWCEDGKAFQVRNLAKLTREVFPKHFKHSNFASFVRQLNMYGFHKVRSSEEGQIYMHECFLRDQTEKLLEVRRRPALPPSETTEQRPIDREQQLEREVKQLKSNHSALQTYVQLVADQSRTISKQNHEYLIMMTEMREDYRRRIQALLLYMIFGKNLKQSQKREFVASYLKSMLSAYDLNNQLPSHRALAAPDSLPSYKALQQFIQNGETSNLSTSRNENFTEFIKKIQRQQPLALSLQRNQKSSPKSQPPQLSPIRDDFFDIPPPSPIATPSIKKNYSQDEDWQQFIENLSRGEVEKANENENQFQLQI